MIKLADTLKAMSDFPVALADSIYFNDDSSLQEKFDNKELGGGDSSVTLTQEEYEALPEEEKLDGLYYTYDTKRIYKNGVQYGASEPIPLTMEEYKALKAAGAIDEKQEYLVEADAEGILLEASDIGYSNAVSNLPCTTVQGAIDYVAGEIDKKAAIDDTQASTETTWSSEKIASELGVKVYTSLAELGLTTPSTVGEVFMVMPEKSMLMLNVEALVDDGANVLTVTDVPEEYGVLTIDKWSNSRFRIEFNISREGRSTNIKQWIGTLKGTDGTGLKWKELATMDKLGGLTFSVSGKTLTITNGTNTWTLVANS